MNSVRYLIILNILNSLIYLILNNSFKYQRHDEKDIGIIILEFGTKIYCFLYGNSHISLKMACLSTSNTMSIS